MSRLYAVKPDATVHGVIITGALETVASVKFRCSEAGEFFFENPKVKADNAPSYRQQNPGLNCACPGASLETRSFGSCCHPLGARLTTSQLSLLTDPAFK